MIPIDANIFIYAAAAEHANKAPSAALLRRVALGEVEAAVNAEVLQRSDAGRKVDGSIRWRVGSCPW